MGDFGAGTAVGLASGGVGKGLSAAGHVGTLREMIRDKSPEELREMNEQKLEAMGTDASVVDLFLANESFTPTTQTAFVAALEDMTGVSNRGQLVKVAVLAKNEDQALWRLDQARMYARLHRKAAPLASFVEMRRRVAVAAKARNGDIVVAAPADYVALTRDLAGTEIEARGGLSEVGASGARHLWVAGGMSSPARQWFESNGWTVHVRARKRLLPEAR